MGLQNQLTDVSTDSFPLFLLTTIATGVSYLRRILAFTHYQPDDVTDSMNNNNNNNLTNHLNLNHLLSYKHNSDEEPVDSDCVICLNRLSTGDHVRKLTCLHVFHKECFDGWLHHLNFNCPLCRSPVVLDERVAVTRRSGFVDDVIGLFWVRG